MSWIPLAERFSSLPLILAGPLLRRVEPGAITVWLALKAACTVTLRVYAREDSGDFVQRCEGTRHTIRLGNHLHLVAVTASTSEEAPLHWGGLYYYDLFFQADEEGDASATPVPATAPHLASPAILTIDPARADPLQRLLYPGEELPSFVLPPEDLNLLRIVHGSCRKPHGAGREMLSALDTILAGTIQRGKDRPQQFFLTGDQIYADDVAPSLLFALIDAGNFLFSGNEEEVLPGVGVPACALGPGERGPTVRSQAMFTTTTPQNQLLALREYASMYLFAWSNVLWPVELPDAQQIRQVYPQAQLEAGEREQFEIECVSRLPQLEGFRALLPQVRRALAHIATYTICDDHEITDDWFLDGAWCQQVLASAPGRWVVRNGLLAYALFQAWGNTPEQFAEPDGAALLKAVDTWRGEASGGNVEEIEEIIGLPQAFGGTGTLSRSGRALHWHHCYAGPRYQVLLLDTRTQRLYHSPHDFPGLLSPQAMQAQVASAVREDAQVTLIVSPTPVLGVDFIESIQDWIHWFVRDNYAYDCEAWALEWGTFQHLLKTVSPLKRVVFLSGDVHYAFGSSMEYWDERTHATAKLVDFTASPFHNEGAGAHIAILAIGYPRLLHLLRRQGTPTMDFFAWDISNGDHHLLDRVLALIRQRIYLFWWSIPRLLAARHSPDEIVLPAHGWLKDAFLGYPPDRAYRLRYLPNSLGQLPRRKRDRLRLRTTSWWLRLIRFALEGITLIETGARKIMRTLLWKRRRDEETRTVAAQPAHALARQTTRGTSLLERQLAKPRNKLVAALLERASWLNRWKAGELIVGYNNLGEIFFTWTEHKKVVTQRLWYRADDGTQPLRKVDYHETLEPPALDTMPPLP